MSTNGTPTRLALALSDQDQLLNRLMSVSVQKVGVERGPKGRKTRFGDDHVLSVLLPTSYTNLKTRDQESLDEAIAADANLFATLEAKAAAKGIQAWDGRGKNATQVPVTAADFEAAYDKMVESIGKTLAGTNTSTSEHVYETLAVDGQNVPCAKVYIGGGNPDDKRTPVVGAIYISGVQVASHLIEAAVNGPIPASKSGGEAVAKRLITSWLKLPSRRWRQFRLQADESWRIKVGGDAALVCDTHKVTVSDDDVREVLGLVA